MDAVICKKHASEVHDIFINYRVASEKDLSLKLFYALSTHRHPTGKEAVKVFLDRQCLPEGEEYEKHFVSAITNSTIIVLLISEAGIANIQSADQWQDNVLLEYELALEQHESEKAFVLPLLIPTIKVVEGETYIVKFKKFGTDQYPDAPHKSPKSSKNVRETMKKLFSLQGVHIDLDNLDSPLPGIVEKLPILERKRIEKYLNGPDGEVIVPLGGKDVKLYRHEKAFYISLIHPNFSFYKNPTRAAGNDQLTVFSKIRYDPFTNLVKNNDFAFAANVGKYFNSDGSPQLYGTCGGCEKESYADGHARIDLRGTSFALKDTFKHEGWKSAGTWTFSYDNQVVVLTGGGFCGSTFPIKSEVSKEKGLQGGWVLEVKII